jgi:hypothetical protein
MPSALVVGNKVDYPRSANRGGEGARKEKIGENEPN